MEIIKLRNVSKSFGQNKILSKANLIIEKGETAGIIGQNGTGKSVLFKLICGICRPDEGEIYINGELLGKKHDFPDRIGIFIDGPGFIDFYTGYRNLKFLAEIQGIIGDKEIRQAMSKVGLDPHDKTLVKNYSLGMKQKLGIAQALMEDPDILLLDEPFNALDQQSHERMIGLLKEMKNAGKTILLTSHNKDDIEMVCDKKYQIENQKIVFVRERRVD